RCRARARPNAHGRGTRMVVAEAQEAQGIYETDIASVAATDWPSRKFPSSGTDKRSGGGFDVIVKRSVLNDIHRHGRATPEVEVCGVLLGNVYQDEQGPFLHVE